ncbi:MAG: hypothetical protein RJB56_1090 [Actinomycetota bacterium]|jgi:hypothetical protein
MPLTPATEADIAEVSRQLGRPARDIIAIAARCVCGKPTVVHTKPRLSDGTPFPTTYYLTHKGATAAVSTLEASGLMAELQQRLADEPQLAAAYQKAHEAYIADRNRAAIEAGLEVPEISGISAGGMPTRVKCLHALIGHALAAGPGVNPIGDIALEACSWSPNRCVCESL